MKHFNNHLKFVTDYPEEVVGPTPLPSGEREKTQAIDSATLVNLKFKVFLKCFEIYAIYKLIKFPGILRPI